MNDDEFGRWLSAREEYGRICLDHENEGAERSQIDEVLRRGKQAPHKGRIRRFLEAMHIVRRRRTILPQGRIDELESRLKYLDELDGRIRVAKAAAWNNLQRYRPSEADLKYARVLDAISEIRSDIKAVKRLCALR